MYQSIPSLTIPRATPGHSHILVAPRVGFSHLCLARGSAQGVLNQNKNSIIFEKSAVFALSLNPKSTGLFPPGAALGGGGCFHPLYKIRSRHPRKLKFTGLIAYVMFHKICKFESLTIMNDVIMT